MTRSLQRTGPSMSDVLSISALLLAFLTTTVVQAEDDTSLVEPGAKVTKLASGMKFTEGPVWMPKEKKLIFSDIPNSKLMQWSEADGLSVFRTSEQANGNTLDPECRLISCQHAARNVVRTEVDGTTTVLAGKFDGKRLNSPNDVTVRSDGTLWFTDPPYGLKGTREIPGNWVFKLNPKTGKVEAVIKDLAMPNGIEFSPEEDRLYVADTGGHPLHPDPTFHKLPGAVHCYEVSRDGQIGKKLFSITGGSDGMAVDAKGNLYATHSKVMIFSPAGKKLEEIDVPEGPTNVCFGGDDFKTLFITARTSLYSVRMKQPGAKPPGEK
jgi:gluconolactonase